VSEHEHPQGPADWANDEGSDARLSVEVRLRLALIELLDLVRGFLREERGESR
jgi:hypothetical protein